MLSPLHISMGGGFINREYQLELGQYPKESIRDLFLKTLEEEDNSEENSIPKSG